MFSVLLDIPKELKDNDFLKNQIASEKFRFFKVANRPPTSKDYPDVNDIAEKRVLLYDTLNKNLLFFSIKDSKWYNIDNNFESIEVNYPYKLLPNVYYNFSKTNYINYQTKTIVNYANPGVNDGIINFTPDKIVSGLKSDTKALHLSGCHTITIPDIPVNDIEYITVSFWIRYASGGMPFGFYGYDLYSCCGYFGFNTGHSEVYGISDSILANRLVHLTAVFYKLVSNTDQYKYNALYINGEKQNISLKYGNYFSGNTRGITDKAYLSCLGYNCDYPNSSLIGDFRMYFRKLTDDEVKTIYEQTK